MNGLTGGRIRAIKMNLCCLCCCCCCRMYFIIKVTRFDHHWNDTVTIGRHNNKNERLDRRNGMREVRFEKKYARIVVVVWLDDSLVVCNSEKNNNERLRAYFRKREENASSQSIQMKFFDGPTRRCEKTLFAAYISVASLTYCLRTDPIAARHRT